VSTQQAESLVTIYNLEHPRSLTRRIKACLTLAGAAAAGILALTATSPAANADTVDLPVLPVGGGEIDPQSLGIAPFFIEQAYEQNGTYTDLLGDQFNTTTDDDPFQINLYEFPGINPSLVFSDVFTQGEASDSGAINGIVEPTTFSASEDTNLGLYNIYENTPFEATGAAEPTQNINDVLLYDPSLASPYTDPSAIEFGIQYLDLPDAAAPVDAINVLGSGGEILFSIPVTGDLFAGL
jgi:hypothetical protein